MDSTQAITGVVAIAALTLPVALAALAMAQRLATLRPRVPSSRLGGIVVLCAALGGAARTAPGSAATAPITTRAVPPSPTPSPPPEAAPAVEPGGYVVAPGDSLWAIACRHLEAQGDTPADSQIDQMWRSIWEANRPVIGDDPDLIFPGTRLTIPEEQP